MRHHYTDPHGVTHEWETPDIQVPLEGTPLIAALNAALGIWSLSDAANIAQVSEQDLINEVLAWAVVKENI